MSFRNGILRSTSGIPIPLTIFLKGDRFSLREFVITMALKSEAGPLSDEEEDELIALLKDLKNEFPHCWKQKLSSRTSGSDSSPSDHCVGIVRAAHTLISLIDRHQLRTRKDEVDDLKRWLEYGKKL